MKNLILIILIIAGSLKAFAVDCFEAIRENPFSPMNPIISETWCFDKYGIGEKKYQFIFKWDDKNRVDPLVSFLVEYDLNSQPYKVSHFSKSIGEITRQVSLYKNFNPIPIPIEPKGNSISLSNSSGLESQVPLNMLDVRNELQVEISRVIANNNLYQLKEGTFIESLPEEKKPFRGYWWPHSRVPMVRSDQAPLVIYDQLVPKYFESWEPQAVDWENRYHSLEHVSWGGHCNGWVASSVLEKEPNESLWDPNYNRVVLPSVQKAWLAETSFCVDWAFYGRRYRGEGDDPRDIYPDKFHKVLLYYIKKLQKPVAMDYVTYGSVDNNVVSGYRFEITKVEERKFRISVSLTMHDYDHSRSEAIGVASPYFRHFSYYLTTNENGVINGGEWISSSNPDFLWVPLSQKDCGRENPHVTQYGVSTLLDQLPVAKKITLENGFLFDQMITQDRVVDIPVPHHPGAQVILDLSSETPGSSNGYIEVMYRNYYDNNGGVRRYPLRSRLNFNMGVRSIVSMKAVLNGPPEPTQGEGEGEEAGMEVEPERRHFLIHKIQYFGKPN